MVLPTQRTEAMKLKPPENYRQCQLTRDVGDLTQVISVTWIPVKYAVRGKVLRMKRADKVWEDGWYVTHVYSTEMPGKVIEEGSRDYRRMSTFEESNG